MTSRTGTTGYNQVILESGTTTESSSGNLSRIGGDESGTHGVTTSVLVGKNLTKGKQDTVNTRDLTAKTITARKSSDKVSIGFSISFKVPILGRFPISQDNPNC